MNMGVLLYYSCQWCFSQNSTLNVFRVVFDLPITSDIILFQTTNYIFEISYRVIEFVSVRAPSMHNILDYNEHFPLKCLIFLQYLCNLIINSKLLWNVISQVRLPGGMVS